MLEQALLQISEKSFEADVQVLRIEHLVSHTVDPLCWLQGQQQQGHAAVYFSNVNQTLEAAAYGASYLHQGAADEPLWNLVHKMLPPDSHLYGGERFDRSTAPDEEWRDFQIGLWMLPLMEVRRRHHSETTVALHIVRGLKDDGTDGWNIGEAMQVLLQVKETAQSYTAATAPPTTLLPPVISRDAFYHGPEQDAQDVYERGVTAALDEFDAQSLEKVVLARRTELLFDKAASSLNGLAILCKWKFGGNEGGHLFYLRPPDSTTEFFGCTPEQLFQVSSSSSDNNKLVTEALAGTRPRGSTQEADVALSRDLFESRKDRSENKITSRFIVQQIQQACDKGLLKEGAESTKTSEDRYFVRRLRHLQHICQRFEYTLSDGVSASRVAQQLLHRLHPTPAVCGFPLKKAQQFIQRHERTAFDRGFYAGPFGYLGSQNAEIVVAIRSGLLTSSKKKGPRLSVYAGAGIVPGSTVQGEWAETSYKLNVVSSLFPQSPITLLSAATPNVAWATAFLEELIRCGVVQFYVCPGSRSTPLVSALAKATRQHVGIISATSVHDERGAAFRAIGHARATGRPAAVITSSGTATANLYPAIMEAGMDGVPLLLLTADRPYESRDTGANQAVDQVKTYSSTYVRWFRDIPPPNDDVPVSVALSDANHGYQMAVQQKGPVHINVQFRENLAPDAGAIRSDERVDSVTKFNGFRFTDIPNFARWSKGGSQWLTTAATALGSADGSALLDLIRQSQRGVIVVGNLRPQLGQSTQDQVEVISDFAQSIGFPIFAGVQSGSLRSRSSAVIPYAEHLLKNPLVSGNLKPDLVIQLGHPLVSTEIPKMIRESMKRAESSEETSMLHHVLIHPHHSNERSDPDFTLTHRVSTEVAPFLSSITRQVESAKIECSSSLSSLVLLGRKLSKQMPEIIHQASAKVTAQLTEKSSTTLTEPQVMLAMMQSVNKNGVELPLFLSNSMPVRDAEFFLYPDQDLGSVGVNRGASGIDGIISSAVGFAEAKGNHTALLIGDLATLHDVNSFHGLSNAQSSTKTPPLTTVVVNNDGGGIFSFLPVAQHGNDVNFEEFFGTPTNTFSFRKGADAFGLSFDQADTAPEFQSAFESALASAESRIVEATVVGRDVNVAVHREITAMSNDFLTRTIESAVKKGAKPTILPIKVFSPVKERSTSSHEEKIMLLLHGWMGDKTEWNEAGVLLAQQLPSEWSILAIDIEGHGKAHGLESDMQRIINTLQLGRSGTATMYESNGDGTEASIDSVAKSVLRSLVEDHGIAKISGIAGYSLGGRIALAMNRICKSGGAARRQSLLTSDTRVILLGSYPGPMGKVKSDSLREEAMERKRRLEADHVIATKLRMLGNRAVLSSSSNMHEMWSGFLQCWYGAPLWGDMKSRAPEVYQSMLEKRASTLSSRAEELAMILERCSPGASHLEWMFTDPSKTLFIVGGLDTKYVRLGKAWKSQQPELSFTEIPSAGHALLTEVSDVVAARLSSFVLGSEASSSATSSESSLVTGEEMAVRISNFTDNTLTRSISKRNSAPTAPTTEVTQSYRPVALDFESFAIDMTSSDRSEKGVIGIGWGDQAAFTESNRVQQRKGFILQLLSDDGVTVGVGEISPLRGLHPESLTQAQDEVFALKRKLEIARDIPSIDPVSVLRMEGGLKAYIEQFLKAIDADTLLPSVMSGLEMALISFSSQVMRKPVLTCLAQYAASHSSPLPVIPLNGLITRTLATTASLLYQKQKGEQDTLSFQSLKVKVGHQDAVSDAASLSMALQDTKKVRPDANRAWTESEAMQFSTALDGLDVDVIHRIEFVEEPIRKIDKWSFQGQVDALEMWYQHSGVPYGLDESIADLVQLHKGEFDPIREEVVASLRETAGCAALVLKPALLGYELSFQLARIAHQEVGVGAVFSSSFDSGVGLSYTAFLAATSDLTSGKPPKELLAHGIGTFSMLEGDTLSPSFSSYVTEKGVLQVASLSRAFFGLGLDEMKGSFPPELPQEDLSIESDDYRASAATSSSGREISLVVSLPLPFSDDVAASRFTDLPQQSRWSPWLSSVAYLDAGRETEWTLNIRGVELSWRAVSTILDNPYRGIQWESISGVKNLGIVEFVPNDEDEDLCLMKVRMTIIAPRIVAALFPGASVFLEDFLQNKLLKWSLEMFRDVVKGDLALERGDAELGDALFGAVEGKANAIEATLSVPPLPDGVNGSNKSS